MTLEFRSPAQVADEYLLHLKSLRPEVNTDQEDSDWYIKGRVLGGIAGGIYSDQRRIADDAFPQSARREALERHLFVYFNDGFRQPTQSNGFVLITGATGTTVPADSLELVYEPNGNIYSNTDEFTISQATGAKVPVQSVNTGQDQNLLEDSILTIGSPPAGIDSEATVIDGPLADGSDIESNEAASTRILDRIRDPIRGGTQNDYEQWALEADDAVTRATILRYANGLGTVGVVITAGTTDIDTAIDNGDPIVVTPSAALIQTVKDYIDTRRPITDCVRVLPPIEIAQDVTVSVRFSQGDSSTILAGQTLTQGEIVAREITRGLYRHPVGGYFFGASGFVVASYLEETLDQQLSTAPETIGALPIVTDRFVADLSASGRNRGLLTNEVVIPGTITVVDLA